MLELWEIVEDYPTQEGGIMKGIFCFTALLCLMCPQGAFCGEFGVSQLQTVPGTYDSKAGAVLVRASQNEHSQSQNFRGRSRSRNLSPCDRIMRNYDISRAGTERVLTNLLQAGADDPLAHPAYLAAASAEHLSNAGIDVCNEKWLRAQSIYRGSAILYVGDPAVREVVSFVLTIMGFDAKSPKDPASVIQEMESSRRSDRQVDIVVLDRGLADTDLRKKVMDKIRADNPEGVVLSVNPALRHPVVEEYRLNGFSNLLSQPYQPDRLWRIFDRLLRPVILY